MSKKVFKLKYFFWNLTIGSCNRSSKPKCFPFWMTSGCLRHKSHPQCAKKKPRVALCGSASVSEYLWCTLWSRLHSYIEFYSIYFIIKIKIISKHLIETNLKCNRIEDTEDDSERPFGSVWAVGPQPVGARGYPETGYHI